MAKVVVSESYLTDIANAIRSKTGTSNTYKPSEMSAGILSISGDGGGSIVISDTTDINGGIIRTIDSVGIVSGNKEITSNGTNIDVTNYATVSVNVPSIIDPIVISDTTDINGGIIRTIDAAGVVSGNKEITSNGTNIDVANYATVSVNVSSGMNMQAYIGSSSIYTTTYTATPITLTVEVAGTYTVSWSAWRSSSDTMGTNLYVNGIAGSNQETFTDTYGQQIQLTNQHYNVGDVLTIYATSGSTSRYINVANLIIKQTA